MKFILIVCRYVSNYLFCSQHVASARDQIGAVNHHVYDVDRRVVTLETRVRNLEAMLEAVLLSRDESRGVRCPHVPHHDVRSRLN